MFHVMLLSIQNVKQALHPRCANDFRGGDVFASRGHLDQDAIHPPPLDLIRREPSCESSHATQPNPTQPTRASSF